MMTLMKCLSLLRGVRIALCGIGVFLLIWSSVARAEDGRPVPTLVHQVWVGPLPIEAKEVIKHSYFFCTEHGIKYMFWNEATMDELEKFCPEEKMKKLNSLLKSHRYGEATELIKEEVLKKYGGTYWSPGYLHSHCLLNKGD